MMPEPTKPIRSRRLECRAPIAALFALSSILTPLGCSGDDTVGPDESIAFLVGDWDATRFVVTSKANPQVAPELIMGLGASFSLNIQPSGQYTAILVFQGTPVTEIGLIEVDGAEVVFKVSFPGSAVNRSTFTITPGRLILVGDTEFDFDLDGDDEPATALIELRRR